MTARDRRVALILGTSTGGVGVHVSSLVPALVADGWSVIVGAPASTHAQFDFGALGATVSLVPIAGPGRELLAVPALRRATVDVDLAHAHGLRAGLAAVLTRAVARPTPLVVTWHNAVLAGGLSGAVLAAGERLVARGATVNLAASADLAARIRGLGGRDVRLAPVSPPAPRPVRTAAAVRAELGLADGQPLIVSVGRLHPQKAHDVLIRAALGWRDRRPTPVVVIAGEGPARDDLSALIAASGAPVRLLGHRRDAVDLLAAADVVVLASRWEARPLAVQEAMQLGRAVVATDVGGVAELVGAAARLIPPGNPPALAAAVIALLDDPTGSHELGHRARLAAAGWPDEAAAAAAVLSVYRSLPKTAAWRARRRTRRSDNC